MKVATRKKSTRFEQSATTYSLSRAKTYLGRLVEKASNGEAVYITRGDKRFVLQQIPPIDPIPIRPPGYFAATDNVEETRMLNRTAKASVVHPPADLE